MLLVNCFLIVADEDELCVVVAVVSIIIRRKGTHEDRQMTKTIRILDHHSF